MRFRARWSLLVGSALLVSACGSGGAAPTVQTSAAPSAPAALAPSASPTRAPDAEATDEIEAVSFDRDGLALAGDLRLPDGPGPHPGVVLVHGSGPLDRDETVKQQFAVGFPKPVAVFADLADGLRNRGYAVLTYDKRTCGPFNGCANNDYPRPAASLTIDAFVTDAQAAVAYLRSRSEIDADAVVVAGHSQGASFVPGMLIDDPRLAAGVMLSAPFDPVDELLASQAETLAALVADQTPPPPGAGQQVAQVRALAQSVADLRTGGGDDTDQLAGASVAFWRSWLRISDGVPQLAEQAAQPILVVTGSADTNVDASQTDAWRRTLTTAPDRVVELDCVSHALNCLGTDDLSQLEASDIAADVDPRVIAEIAGFLDDVAR